MYFRLPAVFASLSFLLSAAVAKPSTDFVTFDTTYDSGDLSLNNVACSDGANGLITKGFTTLNSLPSFPFIGGAHVVSGWNSPQCGTCWGLTHEGNTIYVLAVDTAGVGFNIARSAMQALAGNAGIQAGKVSAQIAPADSSLCGL
jgi:hypothetical protein